MLTSKQRARLRSLANDMDTIMQVGKDGVNENMIKTVSDALEARELIKMRALENSGMTSREAAEELAEAGYPAIVGPDFTSRNKIEVQNAAFNNLEIRQTSDEDINSGGFPSGAVLRVHLPRQDTRVPSPVREDPRAAKQLSPRVATTEDCVPCSKRSLCTATREEPRSPRLEKSLCGNEDPAQPETNKRYKTS